MKLIAVLILVLVSSITHAKTAKDHRDLDVSAAEALMTTEERDEAAAADAILLTRMVAAPSQSKAKVKAKKPVKKKTKVVKRSVV